ncbi:MULTISPECIES: DUF1800 family protein [unclassified Tenacibaculum]|uniref:DUF1800 domain-containing protein n=1 Tax=unclassified Tenacibaculum TaxID=2635139 RepID=UPI001F309479|nr:MULTISPECIES: DUF1800 family protein [unclassified Tenacibaculum]MCF2874862.1 DUF1800 domain-containing protein [Tenacibaculum sp. Cn5-1]MCF2934072.1 DUF1800 domain-containing protein [Tenacibaculum sp. Cn5-34]MCG7510282.1 DUF1800 domain-containing protein [Tenacibaculum sp. Cn5-46]
METRQIQHLYNRIGFGITSVELEEYKNKSKKEIIKTLFEKSEKISPLEIDTSFISNLTREDFKNKKKRKELMKMSRKKIVELNKVWLDRLYSPKELLREKMTLFWANHFVCEDKNVLFAQQYNNALRTHALGDFRTFVKVISKEPAMLKYLNNKQNKKKNPNENFARELMELFTLGQGNYTEKDIQESARAFTGYNHNFFGEFRIRRRQHDEGEKTFLGHTGNFDGDDIIDIILKQKECAQFICEKIYRYFVNDNLNYEHVNKMVSVFYPNYNIEKLMFFVLSSEWFYEEENIGTKIKSPIEFLVGLHTIVPFTIEKNKHSLLIQKLLGQILLRPPNVAGWKGGKTWIDSNTIVTRLRLPSVLLNNAEITYSDKGDLEDEVRSFSEKRLRRRTFIKATPNWTSFENNFPAQSNKELIKHILISPINKGTLEVLENSELVSTQDFCVQLMSLPEYQLC